MAERQEWHLEGLDTFSEETYRIPGTWFSRGAVEDAARLKLTEIEMHQPTSETGGQFGPLSVQDQVFVIRPDGTKYRFVEVPPREGSEPVTA